MHNFFALVLFFSFFTTAFAVCKTSSLVQVEQGNPLSSTDGDYVSQAKCYAYFSGAITIIENGLDLHGCFHRSTNDRGYFNKGTGSGTCDSTDKCIQKGGFSLLKVTSGSALSSLQLNYVTQAECFSYFSGAITITDNGVDRHGCFYRSTNDQGYFNKGVGSASCDATNACIQKSSCVNLGCTNAFAGNYDDEANRDDGSCVEMTCQQLKDEYQGRCNCPS